MLPSTGYFNGINCPFYENGLCDRPYCHFRHVKKILQNTANEGIESGAISQKFVSVTGQKVLQSTESAGAGLSTQYVAVENFTDANNCVVTQPAPRATYNPTPISELNKINNTDAENIEDINGLPKRHIPVTHTPSKPASLPIKRSSDTNGISKLLYIPPPQEYKPGSLEHFSTDKYTPTGTNHDSSGTRNYVPSSEKNRTKKKILEYEPPKLSTKRDKPSVTYQPTPRSLAPCFSSDEEEPENKKSKISNDLNILDDLASELDMVDEIIDDEKTPDETDIKKNDDATVKFDSNYSNKESKQKNADATVKFDSNYSNKESKKKNADATVKLDSNHSNKESKQKNVDATVKLDSNHSNKESKQKNVDALNTDKEKIYKSNHKSKVDRKDKEKKTSTGVLHKKENKQKHGEKKSSHKSSSRDKDKLRKDSKDRHSTDKKKHSSKSSHDSSKQSKDSSSKKSERHSGSKSKEKSSKEKHHKSHKDEKDRNKSKSLSKTELSDDDHFNVDENGHPDDSNLSDTDEETIAAECKKIFEEYEPGKPKVPEENTKAEATTEEEYIPGKKRISRTKDKHIKKLSKAPLKPDFKVSAAQAMSERSTKVREFHNSRQTLITPVVNNEYSKATTSSKVRIAYVPYASTLLKAKQTMSPNQPEVKSKPSTSSTISQTLVKGQQRVAHMPSEKFIDRPGVLEPLASKIPANTRSLYLNKMIDECLKLYISSTDAYARAQHEELSTSKKCSTVQIYKNSASVTVGRLRKELQESNGVKKSSSDCSVLGKDNTPGSSINYGSWSIEKKKVINNSKEFVGAKLFSNIMKWVLTEEQLKENGFPRPHSSGEKGRAIIYGQNKQRPPQGFIRTCCRCKKDYTVNKEGFPVRNEECIYHPNNKYRVRGEARYQCCSQDATADGCCVAPNHVYEYVDYENLKGYVRTLPPEKEMDDYGVYSLDCEMCYTTRGLDLTRVTVIDSSCKVIYETLVKPSKTIIDYNTRYSGITEEQMANVKTTLIEVQATLLAMFNRKTILVGHSLESDFKALKLIHDTVIDTSVLFPHKMGPPYKRALRNLSSEHLKKIIQNSVEGHDSAEDAMVCMELLHYKLKEDLKSR